MGYTRIETPWWVTQEILDITKPPYAKEPYRISANDKCLVASGEQSLLYMINKGQLPPGKYHTITPCFRNEPFDVYHSKYFLKLELIHLIETGFNARITRVLGDMIDHALFFMQGELPEVRTVRTSQSEWDKTIVPGTGTWDIAVDIEGDNIELGSYGVRHCPFATWVYGTGVAEPRFSKVRDRVNTLKTMTLGL
jgi:hypothetical protein